MALRYFPQDQRLIERELILLVAVHTKALDLFDECYDGAFSAGAGWMHVRTELVSRGHVLSQAFHSPEQPDTDETAQQ